MFYILFISFVAAYNIQKQKIIYVTFSHVLVFNIHDYIVTDFRSYIEGRIMELEQSTRRNDFFLKKIYDRDVLFENVYNLIFDDKFRIANSNIISLYEDCFQTLKNDLYKKLNEIRNIKSVSFNDYIKHFRNATISFFKQKYRIINTEYYKNMEANVLVKHFSKQKILFKIVESIRSLDLKNQNQRDFFKNLLQKNVESKTIEFDNFLNLDAFISNINNIVIDKAFMNQQKYIILDFNMDILFMFRFFMESEQHDFISMRTFFVLLIEVIQANTAKIKENKKLECYKILLNNENIIFQASQYKSDLLKIYFQFLKSYDAESENFELNDLTNLIFEFQSVVQTFLYELSSKEKSVGQKIIFELEN